MARTYSNRPPRQEPPEDVVKVQPEQSIVATPTQSAVAANLPLEAPPEPVAEEKPSVWHKVNPVNWFRSPAPVKKYDEHGVTPLPEVDSSAAENPATVPPAKAVPPPVPSEPTSAPPAVEPNPVRTTPPAPPASPHYSYLSPQKPEAGDRRPATGIFTRAREFEQEARWLDAWKTYRQAAETDPAWFEAQYNFGVLSYRLRNFQQALPAFEMALAIRPDSVDARYNFALALKAAGYAPDAARELEKILKSNPNEVRAHLAVGNLYAQQLHDVSRARQHYLKVLALDPANPQATDIQFWLSSNPR